MGQELCFFLQFLQNREGRQQDSLERTIVIETEWVNVLGAENVCPILKNWYQILGLKSSHCILRLLLQRAEVA